MAKDKKKTPATREYTINLHKRMHGITFKKRAPRAVKEVKKFATKMMGTGDVRVDVKLNKAIWSQVRKGAQEGLIAVIIVISIWMSWRNSCSWSLRVIFVLFCAF